MELQKISIAPKGKKEFKVLFNPTQYSIDKANQIAEIAVPGLPSPILQYVHGNTKTLSMELFFDTYEEQTDVTEETDKIYDLLNIESESHAPPICDISWGSLHFRGVLDHASGKYTLFLSNGTPVRATVTVVFKEYVDVEVLVKERPTHSADHQKTRTVKEGDRIENIAGEEYGDPGLWRPIAEANNMDDPSHLAAGRVLCIPALDL